MNLRRILPALLSGIALLACILALRGFDPAIVTALRGAGFDTLQRVWPRDYTQVQPVRVVDIDEASLKELGQWPWPRTYLAKLVDELIDLGAAVVAFDIIFPEPDRMSPRRVLENATFAEALAQAAPSFDFTALADNDQIFADAIAGRPVITAFASSVGSLDQQARAKAGFAQTGADATNAPPRLGRITTNLPTIDAAAAGIGSINIDLAREQGVARQIPALWTDGTRLYPSLAVEALRVAQGADTLLVNASPDTENAIESLLVGDLDIPLSETGMFHVYYRADDPELYVSAAQIISGNQREALRPLIDGHVVFVGTSAVGLLDVRTTALGQNVPGVSVHAQAVEQMLSGAFLTRPEWAVGGEFLVVLLAGGLVVMLSSLVKPWATIATTAALTLAILSTTVWAFRSAGILLDATFPLLALAATFLSSIAFRLLITDKDGRKLRGVFSHYVAPSVMAEIESNPNALKLGGEIRDVTVMFVDIENFTPLSEKLPPEQLVSTVNMLLDACSKAILAEQGTIDKYIGDAVMAFWNAPLAVPDHQYRAACAALRIRQSITALNDRPDIRATLEKFAVPALAVRVGMASGPATVGNMGSTERFDYSVLGETVNIASRAEGICKRTGHDITIAGTITARTAGLALLAAGKVPMKGKSNVQPIHALVGDAHLASSKAFLDLVIVNNEMEKSLAKVRGAKLPGMLKSLLTELKDQHPELAGYFAALPTRIEDFRA